MLTSKSSSLICRHWYGVNVLRTAGVSVMWPAGSAHARFTSLLLDPRSPKSLENSVSRLSFLSQICIFFLLALSSNLFPFFVPLGSPLGVWMTATHLCWHSEMSSSYFVRSGSPTRPEGGTPMNFTIKMNRKLKTQNSSSKGGCPLHLGVKRMPSDISSDLKRSSWYALWRSWISQNGILLLTPYLRSISPDIRATCSADAHLFLAHGLQSVGFWLQLLHAQQNLPMNWGQNWARKVTRQKIIRHSKKRIHILKQKLRYEINKNISKKNEYI